MKIIGKLVEESSEDNERNKITHNATLNDYGKAEA